MIRGDKISYTVLKFNTVNKGNEYNNKNRMLMLKMDTRRQERKYQRGTLKMNILLSNDIKSYSIIKHLRFSQMFLKKSLK